MKIKIIGDGQFGTFLKTLLEPHFEICADAETIVIAVPISSYDVVGAEHVGKNMVNMCSVQRNSHDILSKYSDQILDIHPLFGPRSPIENRRAILTQDSGNPWSTAFLHRFRKVSTIIYGIDLDAHDRAMARTHLAAVHAWELIAPLVNLSDDVPDCMVPFSVTLLRDFVKLMEGMSEGTLESIRSNKFNNETNKINE